MSKEINMYLDMEDFNNKRSTQGIYVGHSCSKLNYGTEYVINKSKVIPYRVTVPGIPYEEFEMNLFTTKEKYEKYFLNNRDECSDEECISENEECIPEDNENNDETPVFENTNDDISNEDVYNALITLQNKCLSIKNCMGCPLAIGTKCYFTRSDTIPQYWKIKRPGFYKAFEE